MTPKKARKHARRLSPGELVEVLWIDSGRDASARSAELAKRLVYGRVDAVTGDTLRLAMDVCTGADEHEDGGNHWGLIWIPSVLRVSKLRRK